jgi:hypothetical protein
LKEVSNIQRNFFAHGPNPFNGSTPSYAKLWWKPVFSYSGRLPTMDPPCQSPLRMAAGNASSLVTFWIRRL